MSNIFELHDVTFSHNPSTAPPVLEDFNLSIEEGAHTAILGANGAGKTTLFYTLTGVYKPQKGEVLFNGEPLQYTREGLQRIRADASVVLQNPDEQIFCSLVEEDIAFGPLNLDLPMDEVEIRVEKALRDVRMLEYRKRPLQQLSGGQRKRVAIAGALAMKPKVMIMDEPTAGLDPQASMEVMELAEKLNLQGVTVLISTHDLDLIYKWADRSSVLRRGKVAFDGDTDELHSDVSRVYSCGLLRPSIYNMNMQISAIKGVDPAPFPRNCSEFTAKFSGSKRSGRMLCIPCTEEEAAQKYDETMADCKATTAIYGPDTRHALSEKDVKIAFNGLDICMTKAIKGEDTVLFYDPIYTPLIDKMAARIRTFGFDIDLEVSE